MFTPPGPSNYRDAVTPRARAWLPRWITIWHFRGAYSPPPVSTRQPRECRSSRFLRLGHVLRGSPLSPPFRQIPVRQNPFSAKFQSFCTYLTVPRGDLKQVLNASGRTLGRDDPPTASAGTLANEPIIAGCSVQVPKKVAPKTRRSTLSGSSDDLEVQSFCTGRVVGKPAPHP